MKRSRQPAPSAPVRPEETDSTAALANQSDIATGLQSFARELQIFAGRLTDGNGESLAILLEPVFESLPSTSTPLSFWIVRALMVNVVHRIDARLGRPPSMSEMELLWRVDSPCMMREILQQHVGDLDSVRLPSRLPTRCGDSRIDRAVDYMREHCGRSSIAVDEVCSFVRLSRWHFSRLFTRSLGMTFRDAIRHLRMERATILLKEHLLSIKEIAARLGFVHPTEFDRQFKQSFNMTPTEWRARYASMSMRSA